MQPRHKGLIVSYEERRIDIQRPSAGRCRASGTKQKLERVRRTMNVEEAADYLRMPLNTLYMKLQKGEVPGSKPGKRWVLFNDELDKWLEVKRKNAVPLTTEEENDAILSSHRRKPNKRDW